MLRNCRLEKHASDGSLVICKVHSSYHSLGQVSMREVDSQNIVRVWERRDGFVKDQIFLGLICALLDATECCSLILVLCYSLTIGSTTPNLVISANGMTCAP